MLSSSNNTNVRVGCIAGFNKLTFFQVSVIYHHSKKIILLVDRSHVKSIDNEKKPLPFSDIYIGGAPSRIKFPR